ncbi:hypothetical protein RG963_08070 [Methanosarcina sp. Z-7115]|uniref:Uncharacterized protein n=1 Tax=Methanosarcina baikalica TaxID=3073890 RepID=A0ABU2D1L2_9EURY|nr:hypothetical protein [Methanosarcina sp. Z-7115]MDR7665727.1 hypothetical protein [Methanosarcina sp. Z-7115]
MRAKRVQVLPTSGSFFSPPNEIDNNSIPVKVFEGIRKRQMRKKILRARRLPNSLRPLLSLSPAF